MALSRGAKTKQSEQVPMFKRKESLSDTKSILGSPRREDISGLENHNHVINMEDDNETGQSTVSIRFIRRERSSN
jgi:hypothetical protein